MPAVVERQVVHEVAADIIRRLRVEPDVPSRYLRAVTGHQRELHGAPGLELVARHQLVLQLEDEHEEHEEDTEPLDPEGEVHGVDIDSTASDDERKQAGSQEDPARGCQFQEEAADEPPDPPKQAAAAAKPGQLSPILGREIELFEARQGAADRPRETALEHVLGDDSEVVAEGLEERLRFGAGSSIRCAHVVMCSYVPEPQRPEAQA